MLPRPRRRREQRIIPLTRVTYSIAEFCDLTGLSQAAVLRSTDDGTLHTVKDRQSSAVPRPTTADAPHWAVG